MPAEIPDEFIDLLERLSEGSLDDDGRARLVDMLRDQPGLSAMVQEHFAVSRALSQLDREPAGFAARTAAHVAKVAAESEFERALAIEPSLVYARRRLLRENS